MIFIISIIKEEFKMSKIVWDKVGEHLYETGVSNTVLYKQDNTGAYPLGVPWNGITAINESPSGAEANPFYADNVKYLNILSAEEYGATIEALMYPDEFAECDGSASLATGVKIGQQKRSTFGLCYRTIIGNDTEDDAYGYKLHITYGCKAAPSERSHATVNESPEPDTMSWEVSTTPVPVTGFKPTASVEIDSTKTDPAKLAALEAILYGTDAGEGGTPSATPARLPLPDEIKTLIGTEG